MTIRIELIALSVLLLASPAVVAHAGHDHPTMAPGRDVSSATLAIAPAASEAVAVVERFSNALETGDMDAVTAALDPSVLILESGGAERNRDEYLGGHAKEDAAFLKTAQVTLKRRTAQASGDFVWVASESTIHTMKGDAMQMIDSTETMVLQKTKASWKIVHIHWSSRRAKSDH